VYVAATAAALCGRARDGRPGHVSSRSEYYCNRSTWAVHAAPLPPSWHFIYKYQTRFHSRTAPGAVRVRRRVDRTAKSERLEASRNMLWCRRSAAERLLRRMQISDGAGVDATVKRVSTLRICSFGRFTPLARIFHVRQLQQLQRLLLPPP